MHSIDAVTRDVFNAIIELRRWAALEGGLAPTFATAHGQLRAQVDKMIGHALACGISRSEVHAITYAVAALADATACKSKGPLGLAWRDQPLLAHYFNEAGPEGFFDRLAVARQENQQAVLRVYALCLALGFRDRMRVPEAERALTTLRDLLETSQTGIKSVARREALPASELQPAEARPWHLFWVPVGAALVCVALYVILSSSMHSDAAAFAGWIDALLRS